MKNYKKYMGCLSLFALTLIGCEDLKFGEKFLDKPISNEQNIDSVFNKKVYAEQALAETYHSLPDYLPMQGRLGYGVLEMLTDLGDWTKKGAPKFYTGTVGWMLIIEPLVSVRFMASGELISILKMWIE